MKDVYPIGKELINTDCFLSFQEGNLLLFICAARVSIICCDFWFGVIILLFNLNF
jgi:hypothetical protein